MQKISRMLVLYVLLSLILTGCFYPNQYKVKQDIPQVDQISLVQQSIERFQQEQLVLPIQTKEADTPIYQKYVIDFSKLLPKYLSRIPANAYEEGGNYLYVLIDVEENPQVRLLDLRLTNEVRNLQFRLNDYLSRHEFLPTAEILENGYFRLDYKKLNLKQEPLVQSPYSDQFLPFIVNYEGRVGIDYSADLYQALQRVDYTQIAADQDIRELLVEDSFFVPAHSFPYTHQDGEPVLKK